MLVLIGASAIRSGSASVPPRTCSLQSSIIFPLTGYCNFFEQGDLLRGPTQWTYHMLLPVHFACLSPRSTPD